MFRVAKGNWLLQKCKKQWFEAAAQSQISRLSKRMDESTKLLKSAITCKTINSSDSLVVTDWYEIFESYSEVLDMVLISISLIRP